MLKFGGARPVILHTFTHCKMNCTGLRSHIKQGFMFSTFKLSPRILFYNLHNSDTNRVRLVSFPFKCPQGPIKKY